MSSPAAAVAALDIRLDDSGDEGSHADDSEYNHCVFEDSEDLTDDETPMSPIAAALAGSPESDRRRLRQLRRIAQQLHHSGRDTKLARCIEVTRDLLQEGFHPVIWCRYVATVVYVAEGLRRSLGDRVQIVAVTGRIGDEERRMKIDEIDTTGPRVLVATDCLSEGINLQEKFTAVLHYDLPWNPNRLEQREGRVDRYGQTARQVKVVRFYGRDNPVDGAVIEVLLDKAREIHRSLGTYVPVPEETETVMQAVLNSLFLRRRDRVEQLRLFDENEELRQFHARWDRDAERERISRTRFAQRALKPEEVHRELQATDTVLGDPDAVREFVLSAAQRLGLVVQPDRGHRDVFRVDVSTQATATLPDAVRFELPEARDGQWRISFVSPTPEGAEYVGRNHRFVTALARYLLEQALTKGREAAASRCGVLRTSEVRELTTLLLLRVRYLVEIPQKAPLLSEEVLVVGYRPLATAEEPWLSYEEALRLLAAAKPEANIPLAEKRELVEAVLEEIGAWQTAIGEWGDRSPVQKTIRGKVIERARELAESHKRIRKAVHLRVRELKVNPQFPPDLMGILVLQPMVKP